MSDEEVTVADVHRNPEDRQQNELLAEAKQNRKILKGRITRAINRVKTSIESQSITARRITKELDAIKADCSSARQANGALYGLVKETEEGRLDQWDDELVSTLHDIEEIIEDYITSLGANPASISTPNTSTSRNTGETTMNAPPSSIEEQHNEIEPLLNTESTSANATNETLPSSTAINGNSTVTTQLTNNNRLEAVDDWIDQLEEFKETDFSNQLRDMSVAEALFKIEATRDIPAVEIPKFDGNALKYVDFIEKFKLNIHDKQHLRDGMRMMQLKMHLEGDAAHLLSGMGNQGIMYTTALKSLKQEFGQRGSISRKWINKLTKGSKIYSNDRSRLRDLSMDIINCIATLKLIKYESDVNATDNLRMIIRRLPDHLIDKWKSCSTTIRDRDETPNIEHINAFIRKHVRAMFDPDFGDILKSSTNTSSKPTRSVNITQKSGFCHVCEENHRIYDCSVFKNLPYDEKLKKVKELRLCFSCLAKGHLSKDCRRKRPCGKDGCTRLHNTLLHTNPPTASSVSTLDKAGILPVLRAKFLTPGGRYIWGNVLLDSGAGTTIIRKGFSKELKLQGTKERIDLAVVGGKQIHQKDSRRVKFKILAANGAEEYDIEAHELDSTVIDIPKLNREWLKTFPHLADIVDDINHCGGTIDLVLGVHYSHIHAEEEDRQGLAYEPLARRTKLGWYVIGPDGSSRMAQLCSINFVEKIDLHKFYALETIGIQAPDCSCPVTALSLEDKLTMKVFEETCNHDGNRYSIGLPWKKDPSLLPNNYSIAERRLTSLERNLLKDPAKAELYNKVINDYEKNGWAAEVKLTDNYSEENPVYYLPHHGIYRPDKESTPLRVVFDPATLINGTSLNSFLCRGPCLIENLLGVLLRFRENAVAFMGDISKMFLQILLEKRDTHVHRFLWRNLNQQQSPTIYRLLRVAFGDKPSPAMASYVMLRMAKDNAVLFPEAAKILEKDRYMDDLIHSCSTPSEAVTCINQLEAVLKTGSFNVKQWYCSHKTVHNELDGTPFIEDLNVPDSRNIELISNKNDTKTLGICWNPEADVIKCFVKEITVEKLTKRIILSKVAMIYDPLGLTSGVTIRAKIALQDLWRLSLDWDDPLPQELHQTWYKLFEDLQNLNKVNFPRCLRPTTAIGSPELHVFGDASNKAYGGIAYLLWNTSNGSEARLVSAKGRVAPLHQTTIPRLELMAALVSSRLAKTIYDELEHQPSSVTLWSDSQVVLFWLRSESALLKPFVGLRVSEIQAAWGIDKFRYLPTEDNPADDLRRGISIEQLNERWMHGPSFFKLPKSDWPRDFRDPLEPCTEFRPPKILCPVTKLADMIDICRFSCYAKLVRVMCYCYRFINRARKQKTYDDTVLEPEEITRSELKLIEFTQQPMTDWEERYRDLAPFLKNGIIRVGGRLRKSPLGYDEIHPILLLPGHSIVKLIIADYHIRNGHCGTERTLSDIRRKFWIVRGRNSVKGFIRHCVICRKLRQPAHTTLMADLPSDRLKPFTPPFTVTGVDLFGPFNLKISRNKTMKAWGAIFTCATVRAVHLEVVENLSTSAFLQALRRFVANHGWPEVIISDNGSNFIGAEKELRQLYINGKHQIKDFATLHKTKWKFNTPLSPHQGGIFESLIKQTKKALKVTVGEQVLTWNEMSTIFAEVKCLLNSRPITYSSSDPNDYSALTPNHFILGRATAEVPQGPFLETKNLHKRFEFVQMLVNRFFSRFVKEYFPTLMKRSKWICKKRQLKIGDIVLLTDPNIPRGKWELSKIIEVYPGTDGIVRNVKVKTKHGEFKRSIQRCCPVLECDEQ